MSFLSFHCRSPDFTILLQERCTTSPCLPEGIIPIFAIAPTTLGATSATPITPAVRIVSSINIRRLFLRVRVRLFCSSVPICTYFGRPSQLSTSRYGEKIRKTTPPERAVFYLRLFFNSSMRSSCFSQIASYHVISLFNSASLMAFSGA